MEKLIQDFKNALESNEVKDLGEFFVKNEVSLPEDWNNFVVAHLDTVYYEAQMDIINSYEKEYVKSILKFSLFEEAVMAYIKK